MVTLDDIGNTRRFGEATTTGEARWSRALAKLYDESLAAAGEPRLTQGQGQVLLGILDMLLELAQKADTSPRPDR